MMKLHTSPTSPYVRKVLVLALETGLDARIQRMPITSYGPGSPVAEDNPLGKIPCLILEDGMKLYDSPVICEYLDSLHQGPKLIPEAGAERWEALRRQALADGILDAAVLRLLETRRPQERQSPEWIARQSGVITGALDVLEGEAASLHDALTLGQIAIGCALGYLDLRFPQEGWRVTRPRLAQWYEGFVARPSMQATLPKDPA